MKYPYSLPSLPYDYNSLEPYIDEATMHFHHDQHNKAYVDKLNAALEKAPTLQSIPLDELLFKLETYDLNDDVRRAVRNNGGGVYNHDFFWNIMTPTKSSPSQEFADTLTSSFGSVNEFKKKFSEAALSVFGSGWVWLTSDDAAILNIITTPNQDTPIMNKLTPLLTIDVWEHAYYLKYQNRRAEYIENWWHVVNWEKVEGNYQNVKIG